MNKKKIRDIEERYGLKPNKRLGQNYLVSSNIVERIIDSLSLGNKDIVLEIGPGLGALTSHLVKRVSRLDVVEIDSGICSYLNEKFLNISNINIIHKDFLKSDIKDEYDTIVSNLPYYCASEIIFKLAQNFRCANISVMVQKELAQRIISAPGCKNYGALTINLSLYFDVSVLFEIARDAFYPRPDVSSSFIKLFRKNLRLSESERELFHLLVRSAFWGRRKKLVKSLTESPHLNYSREGIEEALLDSGIDLDVRGEELKIDDYLRILRGLSRIE